MKFIFVTVGTDHHPFDRLVGWVDSWMAEQDHELVSCLIQYGFSSPPIHARGSAFLPRDELLSAMNAADLVVVHGGPASILEAEKHDHRPVCVARDPALGEHIDGHQQRFSRSLERTGRIRTCNDEETLRRLLSEHVSRGLDTAGVRPDASMEPAGLNGLVAVVQRVMSSGRR